MRTEIIPPARRTTISQLAQSIGNAPAPQIDSDTAARVALAYGLVLFALLSPRELVKRLADIGVTGEQANEFLRIVAETDRVLAKGAL